MASDSWTTLNFGVGGDSMDESALTYGGAPTTRKRARVVLGDDATAAALAQVMNTAPAGTEYGIVARLSGPLPAGSSTIGVVNQGTAAALANRWAVGITDGTNGPAAVKAASTAAAAADPAAVVALSPNTPTPPFSDTSSGSTALGVLNAAATIAVAGQSSIGFQFAAGTFIGTLIPEYTDDNSTWQTAYWSDPAVGTLSQSVAFGSANAATNRTIFVPAGTLNVRVRVSAFTSGTANALLRAGLMPPGAWAQAPLYVSQTTSGQKVTYTAQASAALASTASKSVISVWHGAAITNKTYRMTRYRVGVVGGDTSFGWAEIDLWLINANTTGGSLGSANPVDQSDPSSLASVQFAATGSAGRTSQLWTEPFSQGSSVQSVEWRAGAADAKAYTLNAGVGFGWEFVVAIGGHTPANFPAVYVSLEWVEF